MGIIEPGVTDTGELAAAAETRIGMALDTLTYAIRQTNYAKGWRAPDSEPRNFGEVCALIHSEVSEALESYRDNDPPLWFREEDGKPEGAATELADAIIRIIDCADEQGLPLVPALFAKLKFNTTREYRHGGKRC